MDWYKYAIGFALGVGAGIFGTYKYLNKKYEQTYEEEIESVKSYYKSKNAAKLNEETKSDILKSLNENAKEAAAPAQEIQEKPEVKEVREIIDYSGYSTPTKSEKPVNETPKITYISSDEYDRDLKYDKVILTYYQGDQVLADGDEVLSIDETIGRDAINHIGDYEEDVAFVKNDITKTCYEVIREYTSFSDYQD